MTKLDGLHKTLIYLLGLILIVSVWLGYELLSPKAITNRMFRNMEANTQAYLNNGKTFNPVSQTEYSHLINQYQLAQLQRSIAENDAAIARAKENTARALIQTAKLLDSDIGKIPQTATDAKPVVAESATLDTTENYTLVYTGQDQQGVWAATLKKGDQTFDVKIGTQLPDGYQVSSIDVNGVLLVNHDQKKMVTFSGVIKVKETKPNFNIFPDSTNVNPTHQTPDTENSAVAQMPATNSEMTAENTTFTHASMQMASQVTLAYKVAVEHAIETSQFLISQMNQISILLSSEFQKLFPKTSNLYKEYFRPFAIYHTKIAVEPVAPVAKNLREQTPVVQEPTAEDIAAQDELLEEVMVLPDAVFSQDSQPTSENQDASASSDKNVSKQTTSSKEKSTKTAAHQNTRQIQSQNDQEINLKNMSAENAQNYTVQITEASNVKNLEALIKTARLGNKAKYAEITNSEGNKFYVLTYGKYAKLTDAENALYRISAKIKKEDAFVTTFADIKNKEQRPDEPGVIVLK